MLLQFTDSFFEPNMDTTVGVEFGVCLLPSHNTHNIVVISFVAVSYMFTNILALFDIFLFQ